MDQNWRVGSGIRDMTKCCHWQIQLSLLDIMFSVWILICAEIRLIPWSRARRCVCCICSARRPMPSQCPSGHHASFTCLMTNTWLVLQRQSAFYYCVDQTQLLTV